MNVKKIKNNNGFTLVELIVIITILAILATIAFISFSNYTKNSRDSTRLVTVSNIEKSLNIYNIGVQKYPEPEKVSGTGTINGKELVYVGVLGDKLSKVLKISETPKDPLTGEKYIYGVSSDYRKFQVGTIQEEQSIGYDGLFNRTYASSTTLTSKVVGNYDGILKYSSGGTCVANIPSLLFATGGKINLLSQEAGFIVNKGANIPNKIKNTNKEVLKSVSNTGAITFECLSSENAWEQEIKTNPLKYETNFGQSIEKVGKETIGSEKFEEIKDEVKSKIEEEKANIGSNGGGSQDPSIPQTCDTLLTQQGVNNLNAYLNGKGYNGDKNYWCNLTTINLSNKGLSGTLPQEFGYLYKLSNLTLDSNDFTDISSIKNLPGLKSFSMNRNVNILTLDLSNPELTFLSLCWNYKLADITLSTPKLSSLSLYSYGDLRNLHLNLVKNMNYLEIVGNRGTTINVYLPDLETAGNLSVKSYLYNLSIPKLTQVQYLDLSGINYVSNDDNNISVFANVEVNNELTIRRSSDSSADPTTDSSAQQQYFVTPVPVGSVFCNSIVGKTYVYNGSNNYNTNTLFTDYSVICR